MFHAPGVGITPCVMLVGMTLFWLAAPVRGGEHDAAAKQCIAENGGAGSIDCLERLYYQTERDITRLEKKIIAHLRHQRKNDELTGTHFELAVSSLKDASTKFRTFSARQCDYAVGASGAVASGSGQVRWRCLIELNDWRIWRLAGELGQ